MVDPVVLPAFVAATFLIAVAPGPDNAYISAVAVQHGPASGLVSSGGMAVGMAVHVVATSLGLAALNPKVIVFFASFLPQFARPERGSLTTQLLVLGAVFLAVGLACDSAIGLLVGLLGRSVGAKPAVTITLTLLAGMTYGVLSILLVGDAVRTLCTG